MTAIVHGFMSVQTERFGISRCPCGDPGNYLAAEFVGGGDPLLMLLRCWCGSSKNVRFDSEAERDEYIAAHAGSATNPTAPDATDTEGGR